MEERGALTPPPAGHRHRGRSKCPCDPDRVVHPRLHRRGSRPAVPTADADAQRAAVPAVRDPREIVPVLLKVLDVAALAVAEFTSLFAASQLVKLQLQFLLHVRSLLAPPLHADELDRHSTVVFTAPASHVELLLAAEMTSAKRRRSNSISAASRTVSASSATSTSPPSPFSGRLTSLCRALSDNQPAQRGHSPPPQRPAHEHPPPRRAASPRAPFPLTTLPPSVAAPSRGSTPTARATTSAAPPHHLQLALAPTYETLAHLRDALAPRIAQKNIYLCCVLPRHRPRSPRIPRHLTRANQHAFTVLLAGTAANLARFV